MTEPSLEERLRATFGRAAAVDLVVAAPVGAVVDGARRRQRRARTARTALVVAVVLALLGALSVERRTRIGTEPDRIERILTTSGTLLPTWLPDGMAFESGQLQGTVNLVLDDRRLIAVLRSLDHGYTVTVQPVTGTLGWSDALLARYPRARVGDQDVAVLASNGPGFTIIWGSGDQELMASSNSTGTIAGLADLVDTASVLKESLLFSVPVGFELLYEGKAVYDSPRSNLTWTRGGQKAIVSVDSGFGQSPFEQGVAGEPVEIPGIGPGLVSTDADTETFGWVDEVGRQHVMTAVGITRAETLRVIASLVPARPDRWSDLVRGVGADAITDAGPMLQDPFASPPVSAVPATMVGQVTVSERGVPVDVAGAEGLSIGEYVTIATNDENVARPVVVRVAEDRWVGVDIAQRGRMRCAAEAAFDGARLTGWSTPCDPSGRFTLEGACAVATCRVGLQTFTVRIVDERIVADPSTWVLGAPGPALTGEAS